MKMLIYIIALLTALQVSGQKNADKTMPSRKVNQATTAQDTNEKTKGKPASNLQGDTIIPAKTNDISITFNLSNEEARKEFEKIYNKYNDIEVTDKIGTFTMKRKAPLYIEGAKPDTIEIEDVIIQIGEGTINHIKVKTVDNRIFFNINPISLQKYNLTTNHRLREKWKTDKNEYIKINEVLKYEPEYGSKFVPDNIRIDLDTNTLIRDISIENNLKTLVDFRAYSDFFSLIDEAANGIISFEGNAKVYIIPSNFRNSNIFMFKSLNPYVYVRKFDSDKKFVKTNSKGNSYQIDNKMDLLQKSYLTSGLNLEFLSFKFKNHLPFKIKIPIIGQYNIVRLDSLSGGDDLQSTSYGTGLIFGFKRTNNFGLNVGALIFNNHHLYNSTKNINQVKDFRTMKITSEMFLYPNSKNRNGAIFLRLTVDSSLEKNAPNSYFQLQFGYKADLNFSSKKE